jgi:ATP-dependent DNA helicase RecQ
VPLTAEEQGLADSLRALRRAVAGERGVPPFVIFSDATLEEMARVRPASPETLVNVRGIGRAKAGEFGERFLAHIATYCRDHGLALDAIRGSRPRNVERRSRSLDGGGGGKRSAAKERSFAMFGRGCSVHEVAAATGLTERTAHEHLADWVAERKPLSVEPWVGASTYADVAQAVQEVGGSLLRPVFERLGGAVPYETIRVVVSHLKATRAES